MLIFSVVIQSEFKLVKKSVGKRHRVCINFVLNLVENFGESLKWFREVGSASICAFLCSPSL